MINGSSNLKISIKNINIKSLIHELWINAEYSGYLDSSNLKKPDFNWEIGIKQVKPGGYIDHFCGKVININIFNDYIDLNGYDRLYGKGKLQDILDKLS